MVVEVDRESGFRELFQTYPASDLSIEIGDPCRGHGRVRRDESHLTVSAIGSDRGACAATETTILRVRV